MIVQNLFPFPVSFFAGSIPFLNLGVTCCSLSVRACKGQRYYCGQHLFITIANAITAYNDPYHNSSDDARGTSRDDGKGDESATSARKRGGRCW